MSDNKDIGKVELKNDDKTYVYEFNNLTVRQVEKAKEAAIFKLNTESNPTSNWNTYQKSGVDGILTLVNSILFTKEGSKYEESKEVETLDFLKHLPASEYKQLEAVFKDFFSNIGEQQIYSNLLTRSKKQNQEKLMQLLSMMIQNSDKKKQLKEQQSGNETS